MRATSPGRRIRERAWPKLRPLVPYLLALAVLGALVLLASPGRFAAAAQRFDFRFAPLLALLSLGYYLLQGVRWHPLLRDLGARTSLGTTVLLNLAGQSAGLLPGGELLRAALASEVMRVDLGRAVASITVQELIYTLLITATAVPASLSHPLAAFGVLASVAALGTVLTILEVEPAFGFVAGLVERVPLARRFHGDLVALREGAVGLIGRWDTLTWSVVSVLQVLSTVTMFWLVLQAVDPGRVGYPEAALVYAVAHLAGALSFSPGGLGGFEAVAVGLLLAAGVPLQVAVAAAVFQRLADKGLGSGYGAVAYFWARRRYHLERRRVRHGSGT